MIVAASGSLALMAVVCTGLGWGVAARLDRPAPERLLASVALSLGLVFLAGWGVYVCAVPAGWLWALPPLALISLGLGRRALAAAWRDREARGLAIAQAIVTAWCVGWLALVVTYSGGGWANDWWGHWQRAVFFLERGPQAILINGFDPLPSRPPLANIVTGVLMRLTRPDFAHYQLATTFVGTLAFLPAALLARRWGGGRAVPVLAVLFMLSPMFVQNATFAWTKLPAAFFTLAAVHWFLRRRETGARLDGHLCAAAIGAALITHYSAGPYAVVLAAAWIATGSAHWRTGSWWRETGAAAATGAIVLALWFAWAFAIYGPRGALLSNTSVTDAAPTLGAQAWSVALNLRDTLVPHFLREVDYGFIAQRSPWGWWRDWFFQLYQLNLLFICGSVAWAAALVALWRRGLAEPGRRRLGWAFAISATATLGVAVHGARDHWGLAHICLQPLALAGLVVIAAEWAMLGRAWRAALIAGATVDLALGILLHFGVQSLLLDQWLAPGRTAEDTLTSYSPYHMANFWAKVQHKWTFFGDSFAAQDTAILALLAALLALALWRAVRADRGTNTPPP